MWKKVQINKNVNCGIQISAQEILKGARWMPRLRIAMKDAINRRNASGRWLVTFDPEVSEWGNPWSLLRSAYSFMEEAANSGK